MASRTTRTIVRFSNPFLLAGFDRAQPPGDYRVDHDEESLDSVTVGGWRRVGSFIHLPGIGMRASAHELAPITAADLNAAIEKDQE